MKCIKCFREIDDGLKFCPKCGAMQPLDREAYEHDHPELVYAEPEEEIIERIQQTASVSETVMSRDDFVRFINSDPQRDTIIRMVDEGVVMFSLFDQVSISKWYSKCAELIDDKLGFYPYFVKLLSQQYEKARKLLFSQAADGVDAVAYVQQVPIQKETPSAPKSLPSDNESFPPPLPPIDELVPPPLPPIDEMTPPPLPPINELLPPPLSVAANAVTPPPVPKHFYSHPTSPVEVVEPVEAVAAVKCPICSNYITYGTPHCPYCHQSMVWQ